MGLKEKLEAIQPPPLDTSTITNEVTDLVTGSLPRGLCEGTLLDGPTPAPAPTIVSPTLQPVPPTPQPILSTPAPTIPPTEDPTPMPPTTDKMPVRIVIETCEKPRKVFWR